MPVEDSKKESGFNLNTTEGITRFLRNKMTTIDQIYSTSLQLLDSNLKLNLPNTEKFIFELLCDRLKTVDFRTNQLVWDLFRKVWLKFNDNKSLISVRTKVFNSLKFNDIGLSALNDFENKGLKSDSKLISNFVDCIQLALNDSRLVFTNDQSVNIISFLLNIAVDNKSTFSEDLNKKISSIVYQIFKLSNTNTVRYAKKNVTNFCASCLPNLMILVGRERSSESNNFRSMIQEILFRKENITNLQENIGFYCQKASLQKQTGSDSVIYLFQLIVPRVDIKELELIFSEITSKFPQVSGALLKEITNMNKSLSTDFLSPLVEASLKSNQNDYNLIIQSLQRNSEVGFKFTDSIFKLTLSSDFEKTLPLMISLFNCYVRSREIPEFIQIWKKYISQNRISNNTIVSDQFVEEVAKHIISLSQVQLVRLTEELVAGYQNDIRSTSIILRSIAVGLLAGVTGSVHNAINKALISNIEKLNTILSPIFKVTTSAKDEYHWKLLSLVLMLYDLEELATDVDFPQIIRCEYTKLESYYLTVFRILEQDPTLSSSEFTGNFVKYFKNSTIEFKQLIFNRWPVLLNHILSPDQLKETVEVTLNIASHELLFEILSNTFIHEQSNLVQELITGLILRLKSSNVSSIKFIEYVPVQCYRKQQREEMLNTLYTISIDIKSASDVQINSRKSILHVLEHPTYRSNIETVLSAIFELIDSSSNAEVLELSLNIVETVYKLHLKQSSDKLSSKFIEKAYEKLISKISKVKASKSVERSSVLNASLCLIKAQRQLKKNISDSHDELIEGLSSTCIKLLSKGNKLTCSSDACWVLNALAEIISWDLKFVPEDKCRDIIKKFGILYESDMLVHGSLFKLVSRIPSYSPKFVMALFINLRSNEHNLESLRYHIKFLSKTNPEKFYESWKLALESFQYIEDDDESKPYTELLESFLLEAKKPEDGSFSQVQHYTMTSISTILGVDDSKLAAHLPSLLSLVKIVKLLIANKSWTLTQYSMELAVNFINKVTCLIIKLDSTSVTQESSKELFVEIYLQLSQCTSNILLFQRYRFSNRQHLLMSLFIPLMECLFDKNNSNLASSLIIANSKDCGIAFQRLMSNLCEPSTNLIQYNSDSSNKDASITTALSVMKLQLRKSLPVLLFNYLKFYLQYQLNLELKDSLDTSLFLIFDVLTLNELNYINLSLDSQSRIVFKNIYEDYKKFGKWKEE